MKVTTIFVSILLVVFMIVSCGKQEPTAPELTSSQTAVTLSKSTDYSNHTAVLTVAEYITDGGDGLAGGTTWFRQDLNNGQLGHDFVYNDPRNAQFDGDEPGVTIGVGPHLSADAGLADGGAFWMDEASNVWDRERCSDMGLVEKAIDPTFPGIVNIFFQGGGIPPIWTADLTQIGFLGAADFPYFAANPNVLGVAFTLTWVDGNGAPTDIDNNGKTDVAFREIYYNDEFEWVQDGVLGERGDGVFDFPAVAIHEVGHGFSASHFGSIGIDGDGNLVAKPKAIMNAIYGGIQHDLLPRDKASHCANWAQWPNN